MPIYMQPFPPANIVNVSWGGRWAVVHITELAGDTDLNVVYAQQNNPDGFPFPPVLGPVLSIGQEVDLTPWKDDPELPGVMSIDVAGSLFHGQIVNFARIKKLGWTGGVVFAELELFSPERTFSAELKIYESGVVFSVASVVGRYPRFSVADGAIETYAETREFTAPPSTDGVFLQFDENGFIDGSP